MLSMVLIVNPFNHEVIMRQNTGYIPVVVLSFRTEREIMRS
jgi:hypothetical protein